MAGLERRYTGENSIASHFDLIAGTSTGGILALGLGARYTAADLLDLYMTRGNEIFPEPSNSLIDRFKTWWRPTRHYLQYHYERDALEKILADKLGDRLFGESASRLCIPVFDGKHSEVFVFKTPHHPDYKFDRFERMVTVGLATSPAPIEPEPAPIEVIESAPVEIVEPAKEIKEESRPETFMLVRPDDTPPFVHVDPPAPADNPMVEHLRSELAAAQEENEQLKSTISDLRGTVAEKEEEIVLLMTFRARLEDRIRGMEAREKETYDERADEFAAFLLDRVETDEDVPKLLHGLPEIAEAIQRVQAARQQIAEPEEEEAEPGAQTWDRFVATYRAADTPLPENHPKLIAGMVAWADDHGLDIEKPDGTPEDARRIWLATAKNCCGVSTTRNMHQEISKEILKRYGSGARSYSAAAMAKSMGYRAKAVAEALDVMLMTDFEGRISREKVNDVVKWTIRRPDKAAAK